MPTFVAPAAVALPVVAPLCAAAIGAIPLVLGWAHVIVAWVPAVVLAFSSALAAQLPADGVVSFGGYAVHYGSMARAQATFGLAAAAIVALVGAPTGRREGTAVGAAVAGGAVALAAFAGEFARVAAAGVHVAALVAAIVMATGDLRDRSGRHGWRAAAAYLTLASLGFVIVLVGLSLADVLRTTPGGLVTESFVIAVLGAGFALAIGLVPLHLWVPAAAYRPPPGASALALGLVVPATVGLLMQVLGGLPQIGSSSLTARLLMSGGLLACAGGAIGAVAPGRLGRRVGYATIAGVGPVLMGLATGTRIGVAGAMVALAHHAACAVVLLVTAPLVEADGTRAAHVDRRLAHGAFILAAVAWSGLPPLGGFAARWGIVQALSLVDWRLALAVGASSLVVLGALLVGVGRPAAADLDVEPDDDQEVVHVATTEATDDGGAARRGTAWLALAVACAACLWGLAPARVIGLAHDATAQLAYLRPF